jgi:hypothetical protein
MLNADCYGRPSARLHSVFFVRFGA